jgi:hypothetical protein
MVAKQFQNLSEDDLKYIEQLLGSELRKEMDKNKTWDSKHHYSRPFEKSNRILACLNAVKAQRDLTKKLSVKW